MTIKMCHKIISETAHMIRKAFHITLSVLSCSSTQSGSLQLFKTICMLAAVIMYGWKIPRLCFIALTVWKQEMSCIWSIQSSQIRQDTQHLQCALMQQEIQVTCVFSPGVHCPLRPGGCSVPGCRSVWCHSCWWFAAVFQRGQPGPAAPQWTAAAEPWRWLHVPPSPEGTGQSGRLPWRQRKY